MPEDDRNLPREDRGFVTVRTRTVHRPEIAQPWPGILAADAFDANDTVGSLFEFKDVARYPGGSFVIVGALLYDQADQNAVYYLHLFRRSVTIPASDAAWTLADNTGLLYKIATISIPATTNNEAGDEIDGRFHEVNGLAIYRACEEGSTSLFGALSTSSTPTYATLAVVPRVQLILLQD